jgi:hypothetical protein
MNGDGASPSPMRRLAISLLAALAACGDLEVKSVRAPDPVAAWEGQWDGSWSSSSGGSGSVTVRVQSFRGEPVVAVEFSNPCFATRTYELVLLPNSIELRADGETVLAATLGDGPRLVGTYDCTTDFGLWDAVRVGDLPAVLDLAGTWAGNLQYATGGAALALALEQEVVDGVVRLSGRLDLGGLWPVAVPVAGRADFREDGYDVMLRSTTGTVPDVVLSGVGEAEPLRIELGLFQSLSPGVLPFTHAGFGLARLPD